MTVKEQTGGLAGTWGAYRTLQGQGHEENLVGVLMVCFLLDAHTHPDTNLIRWAFGGPQGFRGFPEGSCHLRCMLPTFRAAEQLQLL